MPLSPESGQAVGFERSINFPMRAGEQPASVQVTHQWLSNSAAAGPDAQEMLQRVDQLREELEELASRKYDNGDFILDDGLVVVKIESGD